MVRRPTIYGFHYMCVVYTTAAKDWSTQSLFTSGLLHIEMAYITSVSIN